VLRTTSVAEPEPVEQPLFARPGAGARVFWPGSGSEYVNSYKMLQKDLNFFILKFEVEFNKFIFVLVPVVIYSKEPFDDHFWF
jgi:hypothetical protein